MQEAGSQASPATVFEALTRCGMALGLFLQGTTPEDPGTLSEVTRKVRERDEARKRKDFKTADAIRAALKGQGVSLEDTPAGTLWHRS